MSLLSLLGTGSLSADEVSKLTDLADFGNILSLINEITLSLAFTWAPGDVGNLFSAIFIKMGQSPRYSTIYYSSRLEVMLYYSKVRKGLITYAPAIPVNMLISYSFPPTDGRFILYSIASRFIYNFWLPMLFIAMITGVWLITWLVEFLIKAQTPKAQKGITPHFICRKIRVSLQNFLVGLIYCNLGDIILYAILEWQGAKYYHGSDWFSFSLSLLFIILILVILCRHGLLIWQYQQLKKTEKTPQGKQKLTDYKYNREGLKLMFESFKDTSLFDQGFLLFFLLRIALSYLFFGCLINHPQVEAILIFVITVLFIAFACYKRPFNSILDFIQYILFEVVTLLVNICLLVLASYDAQEQLKESSRNAVSEIILFSTLIFGFLSPIFLVIKGVMLILNYYRGRPTVKVAENQSTAVNNSVTHDPLVGIDNSRNSYQMEKEMNPIRPRQRKAERLEETEHSIGEIYDAPDNHTLHPPPANNYRNNTSPNQYNNNNSSNNYYNNNDNSPQGNNYYNNNNAQGGQGNVVLKKKIFGKNGGYVNSERQDRNYYDQNQNGNYVNDNDNGNYYNNNGNGNRYNDNGYGERSYGGNNVPNYRNNYRDRSGERANDYVRNGERRVIAQSQRAKRQDYGQMQVGPVRANRVFNRRLDRDAYRGGQLPGRGYEDVQETHFRSNIEGRNRYV